ncbi:MAG TPA: 50S ribosomal protein L11 methyltransferase [Flavisolibacter sp.]|jgi:ribosomal protein L11 methyltransferase
MQHIRFTIQATEERQEELIGLLYDLQPEGFEQTGQELIAYFNAENFNREEVEKLIGMQPYSTEVVEEQNWNAVWESNFSPVVVDDFCAVRAHFHEPILHVQHEIVITPKMSFGTGHHATTYMMMRAMNAVDFRNKTVFDFGTGTGVLAILAEKLGAASVEAIDVDDWSMENAAENIAGNNCSRISIRKSSIIPQDRQFDIMLANINRNVLLDNMRQLSYAMAQGGSVLMSGLLPENEKEITVSAEENSLKVLRKEELNNWLFLLFVKD